MKKTLVLPAVRVSRNGSLAPAHSNTNLPLVKHSIVLVGLLKHAQPRRGWLRAVLALAAPLALAVPAAAERHDFLDRPSYQPSSRELSVADMPRHKTKRQARAAKDEQPVPQGPLHIIVSIAKQRVTAYANGTLVGRAPISTGMPDHPTPMGVFTVISKSRWHVSNIYSGAPMPYMQRITWSGIALHEGKLPGYPASHGCIRLPGAFASTLFGMTKIGARVIVSRDPLTPRPFEHVKLFKPQVAADPAMVAQAGEQSLPAGAAPQSVKASYVVNTSLHAAKMTPPLVSQPTRSADDGQVAILISRQTGKIYIRRNFEPVYEGAIDIQDPELPLGTHLYTAIGHSTDRSRLTWNVVTFPPGATKAAARSTRARLSEIERADAAVGVQRAWVTPPGAALERITFDPDVLEEIAEIARPGLSLLITDRSPSQETGKGTEFVVQTK